MLIECWGGRAIKSCFGCKHLYGIADVCGAQDGPYVRQVNQYTGHVRYISQSKHGAMRPKVEWMRTVGDCGQGAKLYEPTWWMKGWLWLMNS